MMFSLSAVHHLAIQVGDDGEALFMKIEPEADGSIIHSLDSMVAGSILENVQSWMQRASLHDGVSVALLDGEIEPIADLLEYSEVSYE